MSDQHVVIHTGIAQQSGEYRFEVLRYPSLASAQAMHMDQSVIYTSPQDFEDRMTMGLMRSLLRVILKEKFEQFDLPKSKPRRAEVLWKMAIKYARPHNPRAKKSGARAEKRADTRYRVAPLYQEVMGNLMPPQMRCLIGYFMSHMSPDGVDEEGVEMLVRQMHDDGLLVTTQDPVRIWRYYRADMLDRCLLELI